MRLCVYCSSSAQLNESYYMAGGNFGHALVNAGHSLVYGGYTQGIMAAVARAVAEDHGEILAVIPDIFDRDGFTFEGCTRVIRVSSMAERKKTMESLSDAFVVLPGGIGTMDELFDGYVLKSLGQLDKPILIYNMDGFYDTLEKLLNEFTEKHFLAPETRAQIRFFRSGEELLKAVPNA